MLPLTLRPSLLLQIPQWMLLSTLRPSLLLQIPQWMLLSTLRPNLLLQIPQWMLPSTLRPNLVLIRQLKFPLTPRLRFQQTLRLRDPLTLSQKLLVTLLRTPLRTPLETFLLIPMQTQRPSPSLTHLLTNLLRRLQSTPWLWDQQILTQKLPVTPLERILSMPMHLQTRRPSPALLACVWGHLPRKLRLIPLLRDPLILPQKLLLTPLQSLLETIQLTPMQTRRLSPSLVYLLVNLPRRLQWTLQPRLLSTLRPMLQQTQLTTPLQATHYPKQRWTCQPGLPLLLEQEPLWPELPLKFVHRVL
ncbi:hypothetical protein PRIC1_013240 [Phytophthora ramorum]